jgi:hypothetical protein
VSAEADHLYHGALDRAIAVYEERNDLYEDLWRSTPRERQLEQIWHKADRVAFLSRAGKDCEDDLLDLINYAAFFCANGHAAAR